MQYSGSNQKYMEGAGKLQNFREQHTLICGTPRKKFREPGDNCSILKGLGSQESPQRLVKYRASLIQLLSRNLTNLPSSDTTVYSLLADFF